MTTQAKLERYDVALNDADKCAKLAPDWPKVRAAAAPQMHVHCMCAAGAPHAHVHCMCAACAPHVHCIHQAHGRLGNALVGLFELERAAVAFEQAATLSAAEGGETAAEQWRGKAAEQRAAAVRRAEEKAAAAAALERKRREEEARREAAAAARRAEAQARLAEAVAAADEEEIRRAQKEADKAGVPKEAVSAAKATLKELTEARERQAAAAAAVTKGEEEVAARQAALAGLQELMSGTNTTRSKLKAALRRAQTAGALPPSLLPCLPPRPSPSPHERASAIFPRHR